MKEYWVKDWDKDSEKLARAFLLKNADELRLTRDIWWQGLLPPKKKGTDSDPNFVKFSKSIEKWLVRKETNNTKYNNIIQSKNAKIEHYIYTLSKYVKELINVETLYWGIPNPPEYNFYGFSDPTFYKNRKIIGGSIAQDGMIYLVLTEKEANALKKKGVKFHPLTKTSYKN